MRENSSGPSTQMGVSAVIRNEPSSIWRCAGSGMICGATGACTFWEQESTVKAINMGAKRLMA